MEVDKMRPVEEKSGQEHIGAKREKDVRAVYGRRNSILPLIRNTQEKCSDGVKMLPIVHYERKLWFFDERLRQLRNVRSPHDFIDLNDFEVEYFKNKMV